VTKSLEGKVAIVTGGAGGIGQAYAGGLARAGVSVVVADLNGEGAAGVGQRLTDQGFEAMGVQVDVTDPASAQAMVDQTCQRFGGIDILVNNAGIMSIIPKGSLLDVSPQWWDKAMRINAMSVLVCTKPVVPVMKARGGGRIINQASTAAFEPAGLYRISKHAVLALTAGLAKELGADNITVNAIAPGMIQTEEGFRSAGALGSPQRTARGQGVPNPQPDRPPEILVDALLLLATNDYINGQTIVLDGGRNMRL
jgi:NAD(P)-dependent dehydrogenase (short-subunit alcohol dehydrogenase family)